VSVASPSGREEYGTKTCPQEKDNIMKYADKTRPLKIPNKTYLKRYWPLMNYAISKGATYPEINKPSRILEWFVKEAGYLPCNLNDTEAKKPLQYLMATGDLTLKPKELPDTPKKEKKDPNYRQESKSFLASRAWLELRYKAIIKYGRKCMCCGTNEGELHVDHIKPRYHHPELALDIDNLQILCRACNMGKGAWDETDWRGE